MALAFDIFARDHASGVFRNVGREVETTQGKVHRLGGAFTGMATAGAAAVGVGLVVGIAKLGDVLRASVVEGRESNRVTALTAQVIKTTGGAAHITAAQVGALSSAISLKTGIDDEQIQSSANLLLTFKQVRNEVGKGNDVFNQATQAAIDLSAAGFGDTATAAKMLGKALNDPVHGLTALQRAGVTFTQGQKDQIKSLVATGHSLEAQKLMLKEVQSQVGGAAAATATAGQKMSVAWKNVEERLGKRLIPLLDKVQSFITARVIPAVDSFFTALDSGGKGGGQMNSFIRGLLSGLHGLQKAWNDNKKELIPFLKIVGPALGATFLYVVHSVTTGVAVLGVLGRAFRATSVAVNAVLGVFRSAWRSIVGVTSSSVGSVISVVTRVRAVAGIIGGAFTAARAAAASAIGGVVGLAASLPGRIRSAVGSLGSILFNAGRSVIQGLIDGITSALGPLSATVAKAAGIIKSVAGHLGIHSPSTYMDWVGRQSMAGLIGGLGSKLPALTGQMRDVSDVVGTVGGTGIPQLGAGPAGGGSSSQPLVVQLMLDGRVVQQVLLAVKRSNGGVALGLA